MKHEARNEIDLATDGEIKEFVVKYNCYFVFIGALGCLTLSVIAVVAPWPLGKLQFTFDYILPEIYRAGFGLVLFLVAPALLLKYTVTARFSSDSIVVHRALRFWRETYSLEKVVFYRTASTRSGLKKITLFFFDGSQIIFDGLANNFQKLEIFLKDKPREKTSK